MRTAGSTCRFTGGTAGNRRLATALIVLAALAVVLGGCFGPIERPTADFGWCPDGSRGDLDYWFYSMSATVPGHAIVTYRWEFDDGTPPFEGWESAWHRFAAEGVYRVALVVTDSRGVSGTVTREVVVTPAVFIHPTWRLTLGWPVEVSGVVESRHTELIRSVYIRAKFYDADGVRLTEGIVEVTDLEPGEKAAFSIRATDYSSRIFHATVRVDSFHTDCPEGSGITPPRPLDAPVL